MDSVTIEHEYLALLLSIDDLQYPLLRNVPLEPLAGSVNYEISKACFLEKRLKIIDSAFILCSNFANL